jgi:hypothetical protein
MLKRMCFFYHVLVRYEFLVFTSRTRQPRDSQRNAHEARRLRRSLTWKAFAIRTLVSPRRFWSVCTCKIQYRFLTTYQISQRCLLLGIHMTRYSLLISLACPVCMHSMVSRSYYEATHTGSTDGIFYKNESDIRDGSSSQYCIPISASLILRRDEMPSLGN